MGMLTLGGLNLGLDSLLPFHYLANAVNAVLPGWLIQKLILLAIFTLAGLGMHRLVPAESLWAKYAAGVLYVINPFTYSRFMTGQYLVLAGYALMPWFVGHCYDFLDTPTWRTALRLTLWTAAIGFLSIHFLGFAVGSRPHRILASLLSAIAEHRQAQLGRLALWGVARRWRIRHHQYLFWLVPTLTGHSAAVRPDRAIRQAAFPDLPHRP
jgi:hypothetical protein